MPSTTTEESAKVPRKISIVPLPSLLVMTSGLREIILTSKLTYPSFSDAFSIKIGSSLSVGTAGPPGRLCTRKNG